MPVKKEQKPKKMEDYEVMAFIIDNYSPVFRTASQLIKKLRTEVGRSCSEERFRVILHRFVREYAPQDLLKK